MRDETRVGLTVVVGLAFGLFVHGNLLEQEFSRQTQRWIDKLTSPGGMMNQQRVNTEARRVAGRLGLERRWRIQIEPDVFMPDGEVKTLKTLAHITKGDGMCIVHLSESAVDKLYVVAHELCHCKLDWDVMGEYGYTIKDRNEIVKREKATEKCAAPHEFIGTDAF